VGYFDPTYFGFLSESDYFECDYFDPTYFDTPDCDGEAPTTGRPSVGLRRTRPRPIPAPLLDEADEFFAVI
jgi:hypothetical protein